MPKNNEKEQDGKCLSSNPMLRLELFISTFEDYRLVASSLPLGKGLTDFIQSVDCDVPKLFSVQETDFAPVFVRLMLQRKYFDRQEDLHFRKLLKSAADVGVLEDREVKDLTARFDRVNEKPLDLALSDGNEVSNQYANSEEILYSSLLHGQLSRMLRRANFPEDMRLLSAAPYTMQREKLLFDLDDLLKSKGVEHLGSSNEKASSLSWPTESSESKGIQGSPYWSNLRGRDISEDEINEVIVQNSAEDNYLLSLAGLFFHLLRADNPNVAELRKYVSRFRWLEWGDFSLAIRAAKSVSTPGFSSMVRRSPNSNCAEIRILANVEHAWATSTPQVVGYDGISINLKKTFGKWKVYSLTPHGIVEEIVKGD